MKSKIAVCQAPPVYLDRAATMEKMNTQVQEAAGAGAEMVVFPEAMVPGYPTWIWRLRPGADGALTGELHARLLEQAVDVEAGHLEPVQAMARTHGVTVAVGFHEREGAFSRSTLFNSAAIIGPDGALLNHHRKLMPTNPERMVWGAGDARGLRVVETPVGRVGVLICWENYMPLARYALYADGLELLLAPTWASGPGWLADMQFIAREGRCYVATLATALRADDLPDSMPGREQLFPDPDEWINPGDAAVIAPEGEVLVGQHHRETSPLYAEIDATRVAAARRSLDVAGHYARADVLRLEIDRSRQEPVKER